MHPRTAQMVATAESVEWIEVRNEVEALMLEWSLIKQHRPRFNIRLRDDKSYPFLAVTVDEEWPRALVMRGRKRKGVKLLRAVRACVCDPRHARSAAAQLSDPNVQPRQVQRAPSTRSSMPAVPHREVQRAVRRRDRARADYRQLVNELCDFLDGDTDEIVKRLDADMTSCGQAARVRASGARFRDRLAAVNERSRSSRWSPNATRTSTSSVSPRTSSKPRSRSSTCARVASSAARASSSTRSRT